MALAMALALRSRKVLAQFIVNKNNSDPTVSSHDNTIIYFDLLNFLFTEVKNVGALAIYSWFKLNSSI